MNYSNLIKEFAIITGTYFIGEALSGILQLPIPGNVLGMILLAILILSGLIKMEQVETASAMLLDNLALFFIPPGVGLMLYFKLISSEFVAIVATATISTLLVLGITGKIMDLALNHKREGTFYD